MSEINLLSVLNKTNVLGRILSSEQDQYQEQIKAWYLNHNRIFSLSWYHILVVTLIRQFSHPTLLHPFYSWKGEKMWLEKARENLSVSRGAHSAHSREKVLEWEDFYPGRSKMYWTIRMCRTSTTCDIPSRHWKISQTWGIGLEGKTFDEKQRGTSSSCKIQYHVNKLFSKEVKPGENLWCFIFDPWSTHPLPQPLKCQTFYP